MVEFRAGQNGCHNLTIRSMRTQEYTHEEIIPYRTAVFSPTSTEDYKIKRFKANWALYLPPGLELNLSPI